MNRKIRTAVLLFLQDTGSDKYEQFNKAFELYKESEGKSHLQEMKINRAGFSEDGLKNLLYDLQKLHNITDSEVATSIAETENKKEVNFLDIEVNEEETFALGKEHISDFAQKILPHTEDVTQVPEGFKSVDTEELIPMREEFPFLDDPNCPEVLLVVVGKKISAYRRYLALHAKLVEIEAGTLEVTEDEQKEIAFGSQEAFAENRALYDELNHYAAAGEILGKHPLFRETVAKREVDSMTLDELAKYRSSSSKFFSDKRKALKSAKITAEKKEEIEQAIADREYKLELVNAKLGVNVKK